MRRVEGLVRMGARRERRVEGRGRANEATLDKRLLKSWRDVHGDLSKEVDELGISESIQALERTKNEFSESASRSLYMIESSSIAFEPFTNKTLER